MDDELRRKLKRLGVAKGFRNLQAPSERAKKRADEPLPGDVVTTEQGATWVVKRIYPREHAHGAYQLGELATLSADALALLGEEAELGPRPAFLDTETTGLTGGAGTLVFLTGVGVWTDTGVELHQVFLRDPAEEGAAMAYLDTLLANVTGLVTFNGRTFDLPLLETRFVLQRRPPRWRALPHLDLLNVARRLWRDHLASRRLGHLEEAILDVQRTDNDMPGWMIPAAYRRYLRTGATDEIRRIFYHNEIDILSLVTLLTHTARLVETPEAIEPAAGEWVGIGRVYETAEQHDQAEASWRRALDEDTLPDDVAARLWRELGLRPKRASQWDTALEIWKQWAKRQPHAVEPLVERAKYFEWQTKELKKALDATRHALARAEAWPQGRQRWRQVAELRHREERLQRKMSTDSTD